MSSEYAVDTNRIYGTGQSMGCMTTLILASEYPDLYAACMFVDGQWDISTLTGLENQTFVYFAAEDDTNAWNGAQEVMAMFDSDSVSYKYAQWDGNWSVDELSSAAQGEKFPAEAPQMNGEKPSDLPEMNGQPPQMGGQAPDMNGQPPQMNGQAPNGEAPSDLPDLSEMDGAAPVMGGLLNELLAEGIITQAEYDALCEATAK